MLTGLTALVTAGPTVEPIDPVRFLTNRSSGKQGYAIAAALAAAGADVLLISGPTALAGPAGVRRTQIETAREMLAAAQAALPVDVAICAAAVADWRPAGVATQKIKKNGEAPVIRLVENPDILRTIATGAKRPRLVIGFAAETEALADNAEKKRRAKGCDWILANDVSTPVFGAERNRIVLFDGEGQENWPEMSKQDVGTRLTERIAQFFGGTECR